MGRDTDKIDQDQLFLEPSRESNTVGVLPKKQRKTYGYQVPIEIARLEHIAAFHGFGYPMVYEPDTKRLILEHRLIAARVLGRPLKGLEVVHHINGIPWDNHPDNLLVCPSQSFYMRLEHYLRRCGVGVQPLFENLPDLLESKLYNYK